MRKVGKKRHDASSKALKGERNARHSSDDGASRRGPSNVPRARDTARLTRSSARNRFGEKDPLLLPLGRRFLDRSP